MARGKKDAPEAFRITDAPEPLSTDISARQKRYLVSMLARTVCFIAAGVAGIAGVLWLALIFAFGAIVLPYVAVVMANAATPQGNEASPFGLTAADRRELRGREHHA
ncbi:DUF3099 domain-containing protein [Nocardioides sp.]|uniref:DUF3099 domain-containing protein n=1 Tax=Nocardioides sp. TaxID=35761 RepID=UPI002618285E|nr:DUF3099 domain-containing protein [Nocardioides sp.]